MIQTHIASISISKTEQKACCTLYPHIKKELDTVSPDKLLFRFSININYIFPPRALIRSYQALRSFTKSYPRLER